MKLNIEIPQSVIDRAVCRVYDELTDALGCDNSQYKELTVEIDDFVFDVKAACAASGQWEGDGYDTPREYVRTSCRLDCIAIDGYYIDEEFDEHRISDECLRPLFEAIDTCAA